MGKPTSTQGRLIHTAPPRKDPNTIQRKVSSAKRGFSTVSAKESTKSRFLSWCAANGHTGRNAADVGINALLDATEHPKDPVEAPPAPLDVSLIVSAFHLLESDLQHGRIRSNENLLSRLRGIRKQVEELGEV